MPSAPSLVGPLLAYTGARLALVAVVAGLLTAVGVPLLLATLIGLIAALPLSMLLLGGLRARLDVAVAAVRQRRSAERAVLRARLRGDDLAEHSESGDTESGRTVGSDHAPERQPDADEDRPAQQ
jgi:hypothetical protein